MRAWRVVGVADRVVTLRLIYAEARAVPRGQRSWHTGHMNVHDLYELSDDVLDEDAAVIGPIELRFAGRWPRVDDALVGLDHGDVNYRWVADGDVLAMYIEVPVPGDTSQERLLEVRERVMAAIEELRGDRPVYLHWQDHDVLVATDA